MAEESDDGTLPYEIAPDNSDQERLIQATHALVHGHQVNVAMDALVNVLAEIAVAFDVSLERVLAGVRTGYRFHAEQRSAVPPAPTAKRGEA